jgi:G3E family GTPase
MDCGESRDQRPVKLIFVGGFLGSGKTTALGAIARDLVQTGRRLGIVTNDQSQNLVDTLIVRQMLSELGVPVEEVVEGCFCCRFDDLIHSMETIFAQRPDMLLGEPVGSCTDFVAAVANPIKLRYGRRVQFAPLSAMVDPFRMKELLLGESRATFPPEVAYLFRKQLEEADILVLNKADQLSEAERDRLVAELDARFPGRTVVAVSAREGSGMRAWMDLLLEGRPGAGTALSDLDYDRYAAAEAHLGWLNAAVRVAGNKPFDPRRLLAGAADSIRRAIVKEGAEIGHLKLVLTSGGKSGWANVTRLGGELSLAGVLEDSVRTASLIVNARVHVAPESLEHMVRAALAETGNTTSLQFDVINLQCFRPAYPSPAHIVRNLPAATLEAAGEGTRDQD